MSRETLDVLEAGPKPPLPQQPDERAEPDALAARLASVERAYQELLARLQRYERERMEIKARLGRILARIGLTGPG